MSLNIDQSDEEVARMRGTQGLDSAGVDSMDNMSWTGETAYELQGLRNRSGKTGHFDNAVQVECN